LKEIATARRRYPRPTTFNSKPNLTLGHMTALVTHECRGRTGLIGRPFVKRFALCYRTVVQSVCPVLSVTLVHCGQTVGWIKMKFGTQLGLGPGHIVLDGVPAHPTASPPIFGPYLLWPKGCMDQHATRYGGRPRPRRLKLNGTPLPLLQK